VGCETKINQMEKTRRKWWDYSTNSSIRSRDLLSTIGQSINHHIYDAPGSGPARVVDLDGHDNTGDADAVEEAAPGLGCTASQPIID